MRKRRRRYLVAGIVAAVGLALQLVPWPRAWVDEFYLDGWFPAWSRGAATVQTPVAGSQAGAAAFSAAGADGVRERLARAASVRVVARIMAVVLSCVQL